MMGRNEEKEWERKIENEEGREKWGQEGKERKKKTSREEEEEKEEEKSKREITYLAGVQHNWHSLSWYQHGFFLKLGLPCTR